MTIAQNQSLPDVHGRSADLVISLSRYFPGAAVTVTHTGTDYLFISHPNRPCQNTLSVSTDPQTSYQPPCHVLISMPANSSAATGVYMLHPDLAGFTTVCGNI